MATRLPLQSSGSCARVGTFHGTDGLFVRTKGGEAVDQRRFSTRRRSRIRRPAEASAEQLCHAPANHRHHRQRLCNADRRSADAECGCRTGEGQPAAAAVGSEWKEKGSEDLAGKVFAVTPESQFFVRVQRSADFTLPSASKPPLTEDDEKLL